MWKGSPRKVLPSTNSHPGAHTAKNGPPRRPKKHDISDLSVTTTARARDSLNKDWFSSRLTTCHRCNRESIHADLQNQRAYEGTLASHQNPQITRLKVVTKSGLHSACFAGIVGVDVGKSGVECGAFGQGVYIAQSNLRGIGCC